jgi:predicted HicB family RNase H-like nuclease
MKTQSKPTAKRNVSKVRQNISINPKVLKSAQKVAAQQGLSFSGWNEQLIRSELAK